MINTTNIHLKIAFGCYSIFILITVIASLSYFFRGEFMPYHAALAGQDWAELAPGIQNVILGLMKAISAAWLSLSVAVGVILYKPFRLGERWSFWAIFLILLPVEIVNLWVGMIMYMNSPESTPVGIVVFKSLLLFIGFILSVMSKDKASLHE